MPRAHSTDKKQITLWLKKAIVEKLDELAAQVGISRAALIALWVVREKKEDE